MAKLTLSVDESVVSRAKDWSRQHGVSLSRIVEAYLSAVSKPAVTTDNPPILRSMVGMLKKADKAEYRKYLVEKYR